MKAKAPKTYTLAQVGKLLGVAHSTIYNYINAGLIQVLPRTPGKREGRKVTEAEFQRLKRDGVTPTGIKAKLAKRNTGAGKTAKKRVKKQVKRTAATPEPTKKKSAYVRKVTKKQVKRNAAAAAGTTAKQQKRRSKKR